MSGDAKGADELTDPAFGVSSPGIRLNRVVQVYAWTEHEASSTSTSATGTKTTKKTYTYERKWVGTLPKSSKFKQPEGHENPDHLKYDAASFPADEVTLGAFRLDQALATKLTDAKAVALSDDAVELPEGVKLSGDAIYVGSDPDKAAVGDLRITETVVPNGEISVVAQQGSSGRLTEFRAKAGDAIGLVEAGTKSAADMFATAQQSNRVTTWVIRGGGFLLLLIGFLLLLGPMTTMASIVPFLGSVLEAGVFVLSLLGAVVVWALLVALAWIVARPLIGGAMLVVAVTALVFAIMHLRKGAARRRETVVGATPQPT